MAGLYNIQPAIFFSETGQPLTFCWTNRARARMCHVIQQTNGVAVLQQRILANYNLLGNTMNIMGFLIKRRKTAIFRDLAV